MSAPDSAMVVSGGHLRLTTPNLEEAGPTCFLELALLPPPPLPGGGEEHVPSHAANSYYS